MAAGLQIRFFGSARPKKVNLPAQKFFESPIKVVDKKVPATSVTLLQHRIQNLMFFTLNHYYKSYFKRICLKSSNLVNKIVTLVSHKLIYLLTVIVLKP